MLLLPPLVPCQIDRILNAFNWSIKLIGIATFKRYYSRSNCYVVGEVGALGCVVAGYSATLYQKRRGEASQTLGNGVLQHFMIGNKWQRARMRARGGTPVAEYQDGSGDEQQTKPKLWGSDTWSAWISVIVHDAVVA
jgi:hypothetical protein